MPFIEDSVQWLARNYTAARNRLGRPFALENVSYYYPVPHCPLSEAQFLTRLTELTDCSLLLDVTNIYNNSENHGYDAVEFIRSLPGDRVTQLHLAGGHYHDGMWHDSHSAPVMPGVWDLLDEVLKHTAADVIVLERDSNFTPFERTVMPDIRRAREIFQRHRSSEAAPQTTVPETVEVSPADPDAKQFAGLRNFQRATLREITDAGFRRRARADRGAAADEFPMDGTWHQRWAETDPHPIDLLAEKWTWIDRLRKQDDVRYANWEWQAWTQSQMPATPPSEQ